MLPMMCPRDYSRDWSKMRLWDCLSVCHRYVEEGVLEVLKRGTRECPKKCPLGGQKGITQGFS